MIDWDGNSKIDPVDVGISIATEEDIEMVESEKQTEVKPKGCLTSVLIVMAFGLVGKILL